MAEIPEDVRNTAYAMAMRLVDRDRDSGENADVIAEAILAERTATEARIADLLKDPAAVRLNYLRGGIACQSLIDEAVAAERERCAGIAEMHEHRGEIAKAVRAPGIPS